MTAVPTLSLLMLSPAEKGQERKGKYKGRGREEQRTISQIIWKDYKGFKQIMLSTEGRETEIKRLEKGWHVSAVIHTVFHSDPA